MITSTRYSSSGDRSRGIAASTGLVIELETQREE